MAEQKKTTSDDQSVDDAIADAQASLNEIKDLAGDEDLQDALAGAPGGNVGSDIDLLGDVELNVTVELGRTHMLVEDVLSLSNGSVVELDKLAGDPVDVYVNGRLVARGEVLVLNDNFCIRISEIVDDLEEQAQEAAQQELKAAN